MPPTQCFSSKKNTVQPSTQTYDLFCILVVAERKYVSPSMPLRLHTTQRERDEGGGGRCHVVGVPSTCLRRPLRETMKTLRAALCWPTSSSASRGRPQRRGSAARGRRDTASTTRGRSSVVVRGPRRADLSFFFLYLY